MDIKDLYPQRYYDLKREYRNSMQPMKRLGPKKTPAVGAALDDGNPEPNPKRKSKTAQKKTSRSMSPSVSGSSSGTPNKISRKAAGTDEKKNDSNASVLSQLNKSSSFGSLSDQEIALSFFSNAKNRTAENIPPPPPESPLLSSLENNNAKFNRLVSKNLNFQKNFEKKFEKKFEKNLKKI